MKTSFRGFSLDFSHKTHLMGILNVTPDSFSDGGRYLAPKRAVQHALRMVGDGADIIDVGGLSSRPGSGPVTVQEELRRTVPVLQAICKELDVPVSIDTYRAEVAEAALGAGAAMVNDISGLGDPAMAALVAQSGAGVVLMHMKGTPSDMQLEPRYEALVPEVMDYLRQSIRRAEDAGVQGERMIIDPGIGFGKTFDHNLEIINRLSEFTLLGYPVLVGPSRKAFLGAILNSAPSDERLFGTAGAVAASVLAGASIVRVHDVAEMADVVRTADAIKRQRVSYP